MMSFTQLIARRIRLLLKVRNWTQYKLSGRSGVPCSTISMIINGKIQSIGSKLLISIIRGFDMSVMEFFDDEMFLPENISDN